MLKFLNGKRSVSPPNQPITFSSKTLTRNLEIATAFAKQFTSIVPHTSNPSTRIVNRELLKECPLNNSTPRFTSDIVAQAIKDSGNSNSAGPDGLTIHHLKNLGPLGLQYLTHLNNLSVNYCNIPAIWKRAIIIPVSKPGKLLDKGTTTVTALLPLAHKLAQGFNQPCPPLHTSIMAIDLTEAFDMVNHTKLIRALSLSKQ